MLYSAYVPLYRGEYTAALGVLDEGIAIDMNRPGASALMNMYGLKAIILRERGELQAALDEIDKAIAISRETWREYEFLVRSLRVQILAEEGATDAAERAAEDLRRDMAEADYSESPYWYALGAVQFAAGDMTDAAVSFEKSLTSFNRFPFPTHYMLGRVYLEAGELGKAVQQFEELHSQHADPRLYFGPWTVKSYYYMGLAYERSGWIADAVEQYTSFLEIWKDADSGIAEIRDARERIARLKS
jgi:tetratricopeptide (TPR) repeat protein